MVFKILAIAIPSEEVGIPAETLTVLTNVSDICQKIKKRFGFTYGTVKNYCVVLGKVSYH